MEVEVCFAGVLDCVSKIMSYDDDVLVVKEGNYLRINCVVRTRVNYLQLVK